MRDDKVVQKLLQQLRGGNEREQSTAVESIRDLCASRDFRLAFGEAGAVQPLVGLLRGDDALAAAQTLQMLAEETPVRAQILDAGGVEALVGLLSDGLEKSPQLVGAVLQALLALASEEATQLEFIRTNALPAVVKIIGSSNEEGLLKSSCQLLGRLGHNKVVKSTVREHAGLSQLLKLLQKPSTAPGLAETIVQALTGLVIEDEINQDHVREEQGIESVVRRLDCRTSTTLACAAANCLTALCINNDKNKNQLRDLWAIPLLVSLLEQGEDVLQEKAVDCLRVLTTGNDLNKLSLFSIPAGVRSLVRIMSSHDASEGITERAAAVIGNLSTTEQFFSSIRECGGLQRLVTLLDSGPESRVTEIAAKTLANMAGNEHNRKGIRLAGGRPPLVNLLTQRPSEQVLMAAEEALKRLQVSNEERNAILETLRYCDQKEQQRSAVPDAKGSNVAAADGSEQQQSDVSRPFTQFSVEKTCELLKALGIRDVHVFEVNGVNGGDLLELTQDDLAEALSLSALQAKKVMNLKKAFDMFEAINATPGKAEISQYELREWLQKQGRSDDEVQAVVNGFKRALGREDVPFLSFTDFARHYQWLNKTLQVMALTDEEVLKSERNSSLGSLDTKSAMSLASRPYGQADGALDL